MTTPTPSSLTPTTDGRSRRQLFAAAGTALAGAAAITTLSTGTVSAGGDHDGDGHRSRGGQFFPVDPKRVYDSRIDTFEPSGLLAPNSERLIRVADGCNDKGEMVERDTVHWGALAVAVTVTAAAPDGANYLAVAPGDATDFSASTINFPGGFDIATSLIVKLGKDRTIKVFSGDQMGSTHVLVDVTGYIA